ncbi:unnamed protein product [Urochloa humidicola]
MVVPARGKALVPTDLSIAIPEGTYARIAPRSGLALKYSIDVGAGVVDADYCGPLGVILFNHSDADFVVKPGDRIAQIGGVTRGEDTEHLESILVQLRLGEQLGSPAACPAPASPRRRTPRPWTSKIAQSCTSKITSQASPAASPASVPAGLYGGRSSAVDMASPKSQSFTTPRSSPPTRDVGGLEMLRWTMRAPTRRASSWRP